MFTGIIDHTARIHACKPHAGGLRLCLKTDITDAVLGESIAVDGACLTVTETHESGLLSFDVSPETLSLTVMADYQIDQRVHIERALRVGDRLGGHWVTGHVDECITVKDRREEGDYLAFTFSGVSPECLRLCVRKGSIALAGVSLTINTLTDDGFSVMCIPHTKKITHCAAWMPGERCHVEYDYLLKGALHEQ